MPQRRHDIGTGRAHRLLVQGVGVLVLVWATLPGTAAAQSSADLDRAERELEQAEFDDASNTLADLADSDAGLDREDVARLLRLRAVTASALGREGQARRFLLGLAAVLEGREPGPLPPSLVSTFERARARVSGAPRLQLSIETEDDMPRAVLDIERDAGDLVRETEIVCRSSGVELARTDSRELELPAQDDLACDARAIGPGGWEIDRASARRGGGGGEEDPIWPWIVGGAAAAVLIAVIIGVVVAATGPRGVSGPVWMGRE